MDTLDIEAWCKPAENAKSQPMGLIHFHIDENCHLRLEQAETQLLSSGDPEIFLDVDRDQLELETPEECGVLSDCQLRVYLNPNDHRGHFHLVGHRANDGSLVYTNAVMVDQLG